jgi:hypothetical protein
MYHVNVRCENCGQQPVPLAKMVNGGQEYVESIPEGTSVKEWFQGRACYTCGVKGSIVRSK